MYSFYEKNIRYNIIGLGLEHVLMSCRSLSYSPYHRLLNSVKHLLNTFIWITLLTSLYLGCTMRYIIFVTVTNLALLKHVIVRKWF